MLHLRRRQPAQDGGRGRRPAYTYTYDGAGNRYTRVDGAGNTQTYNYDQLNRMTSFVPEGPAPPTHGYTYNGDGLRMFYSFNGVQGDAFDRTAKTDRPSVGIPRWMERVERGGRTPSQGPVAPGF